MVVLPSLSSSHYHRPPIIVFLLSSLSSHRHLPPVVVVVPQSLSSLPSLSLSHRCPSLSFPSHPSLSFPSRPSSLFPSRPLLLFPSRPLSSIPSCPLSSFPSHRHRSPVIFIPPFPPREQLLTAVVQGAVVVFVPVVLSFGRPCPRSTCCPPCEQWLAAVGAGAGYWVAFLVVPLLSFP